MHRELLEEINWKPAFPLEHWFTSQNGPRIAHVFRGELSVPVEQLTLLEGQDLKLTSKQELRKEASGVIDAAKSDPLHRGSTK